MRHILGSQFAKLYAPNTVEKSVVQLSQSVQECIFFNRLELALSEKQMPRFVRNIDSWTNWMQLLEPEAALGKQVRLLRTES
jgi:hypothetical protein